MPILGGVGQDTVKTAGAEASALESQTAKDAEALLAQVGSIVAPISDSLERFAVAAERIAAAFEAIARVAGKGVTLDLKPKP